MILDLIVSANINRRQLNPGQRAVLALEYEKFYTAANRDMRSQRGVAKPHAECTSVRADLRESTPERERRSTERAARVTGVSGRAVQQAKTVRRDAPDLLEKVRTDETKLDNAYRQARARAAEQHRHEPEPEPPRRKPTEPVTLTLRGLGYTRR